MQSMGQQLPAASAGSSAGLLHSHHMGGGSGMPSAPHPQDFGVGSATGWSSQPLAPPPFHQADSGLPYTNGAEGVYSGVYNPTTSAADLPPVTQAPDIQWDMVLAPEQWDQNEDLLTDMATMTPSGWTSWPMANNPYPYPPMGPA